MIGLKLFMLAALVAVVVAEESTKPPVVEILTERSFVREDGYDFLFKTSDGTERQEEAHIITVGDHQGIGVKGSYSYEGADGQHYLVTYTADENGYRPVIQLLPKGASQ